MAGTTTTLKWACFLITSCAVPLLTSCERESTSDAKPASAPAPAPAPAPKPDPTGVERTTQASQSMEGVRGELQKGKLKIDSTLSALASVVKEAEGKPRPFFDSFQKGLGELETQAAAARTRADEMKSHSEKYFEGWVKDLGKISSESVKEIAEERLGDLKENYKEITEASAKVGEAYKPFISHLKELEKALATDLTAKGIEHLSDQADKAKSDGEGVKEAIDDLNHKLDQLAERLSGSKKH